MWIPDPARDTQWTSWDYALAEAVTALDTLTGPSGQARWLAEDPDVYWEVGASVDYAVQTVRETSKDFDGGLPPEVTLFTYHPTKTTGEFWTLAEWLDYKEAHSQDDIRIDRSAPEGAHPPSGDEFLEMQRLRDERLAAKYAEADEID